MVNPCGFPLLPAYLSYYLGADEARLPRAGTRMLQGLVVGGLVTVGFLGVFVAVGLPVSFGVGAIADAVPWVGLGTGALLVLVGALAVLGARLPARGVHVRVRRKRGVGAMVVFGVGYGLASLGCTLPLFLALVGASLGGAKATAFVAFGAGMAIVLMALAVLVALLRAGAVRAVRPVLPYLSRLAGLLLIVSGGYLFYYWARIRFGDSATLADDPIVSFGARFSADVNTFAHGHGTTIVAVAALIVAAAALSAFRLRHRRDAPRGLARE